MATKTGTEKHVFTARPDQSAAALERKARTVPNPTRPRALRPVEIISDRAKRYRAAKAAPQAERCGYCGAPRSARRRLDRDHIDGFESNNNPANLIDACRACNTRKGIVYTRAGLGKRVSQTNPSGPTSGRIDPKKGAQSAAQWAIAAQVVTGRLAESDQMTVRRAASIIAHTSQAKRKRFAAEIWDKRRSRGTDKSVPF